MRYSILPAALLACVAFASADDLTLIGDKTLKNAQVLRYEADGVVVKHDGGTNRIAWKDLPPATRQRYQSQARKEKEEQIQKLRQDLARAEAEAARLRPDDGSPESTQPSPPGHPDDASTRRVAAAKPARPVAGLPPVNADEIVDATELLQQFKNDPSGADRRYRKKTFRVKGVVERFEPRMFLRKYNVVLESPDRSVSALADFDYPTECKTVFTTQNGQTLVGKPSDTTQITLMRVGQTIVFRGKCKGARDGAVLFSGCVLTHGAP
jgi:hypothetical protein